MHILSQLIILKGREEQGFGALGPHFGGTLDLGMPLRLIISWLGATANTPELLSKIP